MPYLYCDTHGREHETATQENEAVYRQEGEAVLIVTGKLVSGPWCCDRCNAELVPGQKATLISAFPCPMRDELCDYDFGYERQYFAMTVNDRATAYGADWPDDSIRHRRPLSKPRIRARSKPILALDLFATQEEAD